MLLKSEIVYVSCIGNLNLIPLTCLYYARIYSECWLKSVIYGDKGLVEMRFVVLVKFAEFYN